MPRSRQNRADDAHDPPDSSPAAGAPPADTLPPAPPAPGTTGRYLVVLREDDMDAGIRALSDMAGLRAVARSSDFGAEALEAENVAGADVVVFDQLGVAVVNTPPDQVSALGVAAAGESAILAIEPERISYAIGDQGAGSMELPPPLIPSMPPSAPSGDLPVDYLRGYRDAVNHLVDQLLGTSGAQGEAAAGVSAQAWSEVELTWGLQATRVANSRFTGRGIKIAVLDTGLDLGHPDFIGRAITAQSFVTGQTVQDGHGHGTHCIGTAAGPLRPGQLPRYGVAYEAEIFAGKVLSNQGSGNDQGILAGINWAVANGCQIISMSLGARVLPGEAFSLAYEQVASRVLRAGTLIIAAAGNESRRPAVISPVGRPANSPSILAVGALDQQLRVAWFSCGGLNPNGGQVDVAGPGVAVRSSWPRPQLYNTIDGTSMATPHVAGIAALFAEANRNLRGRALLQLMLQSARRLTLPSRDVGAGLIQAP